MAKRTEKGLAEAIIARLDDTYDLIFVAYDDKLSDRQVAAIVRGDTDALWSLTFEWESDCRWESAKRIIAELAEEVAREWEAEDADEDGEQADYDELVQHFEFTESWDEVRYEVDGRESGTWMTDLASNTPRVLLRINVIDEDHCYSFEPVEPERVLNDVGLPVTEHNLRVMADTLLECSPEFSVLLGYWIVAADVNAIYEMTTDDDVPIEIDNPHLYLGNPFAGSGFISEKNFEGTVRVRRGDLRTDRDAFGYSVDEMCGGLLISAYEAQLRPIKTEPVPA